MRIEKNKDEVVVKLEDEIVRYGGRRCDTQNFLTSEGVIELEEWKIDLVKNHGVELNELRS